MHLLRILGFLLLAVSPLAAATFSVTTTADAVDLAPGNGLCVTAAGTCSLRAAVQEANARAGADVIVVPAGTFTLSIAGANEDQAATGDLDIRDAVTILGATSATTIISAGGIDRAFDLFAPLTLTRVTVRDGNAAAANGGAVRLNVISGGVQITDAVFTANTAANGGALATTASPSTHLLVRRVRFEANGATALGGAVYLNGAAADVWFQLSRFTGNSAATGGGAAYVERAQVVRFWRSTFSGNTTAGNGGAIYVTDFNSQIDLTQSTLNGNTALNGGAVYTCCKFSGVQPVGLSSTTFFSSLNTFSANRATAVGGAVYAEGPFEALHNTMMGNEAPAAAGVHSGLFEAATLVLSILANNGPNCGGPVRPEARGNIFSDATCGGAGTANAPLPPNLVNTNPMVGPLADNGGPTLTHHPLPGSPAIDYSTFSTATVDQRGVGRPFGAGFDVGSVEVSSAPRAATTTTLTAFPNPALIGQPITLAALVNNRDTGVVTFRSGEQILGQADLSSIAPATLILSPLPPGTYTITATFEGDLAFAPSTSAPFTLIVVASADAAAIPALDGAALAALAALLAALGVFAARR